MSETPYFSVILPTRNRSEFVGNAIESMLAQSFNDWELIVVDNDVTERTRFVVEKYNDIRIKYFRTGTLAMHDNWEYGLQHATGEYITVLEDKARYSSDILAVLYTHFEKHEVKIISWALNIFNHNITYTNSATLYTSEEVLQFFLSHGTFETMNSISPRFINSCCHRSIIELAQQTSIGRVFAAYAPDYTSMFMQLYLYDKLLYIDSAFTLVDLSSSNGQDFFAKRKNSTTYKDFIELSTKGNSENLASHAPIKTYHVPVNIIISEFIHMQKVLGGRLSFFPIDRLNYYTDNYNLIRASESLGVDNAEEILALEEALSKECGHIQRMYKVKERSDIGPGVASFFIKIIEGAIKKSGAKKVAIWGANDIARHLIYESEEIRAIVEIVVDKNPSRIGGAYKDVNINHPDCLSSLNIDLIVITSLNYATDIELEIKEIYQNVHKPKVISANLLDI